MEKEVVIYTDDAQRKIYELHGGMLNAVRSTVETAIEIGRILCEKKASTKHGEWLPWVKSLPFSQQSSSNYMQLWEQKDKLPTVGNLGMVESLRLLSGKRHGSVDDGYQDTDEANVSGVVSSIDKVEQVKYGCIYADPPWKYDNQGTRGSTDNHYDTLTVDQLCEWPIADMVADKAHLHLWVTNAFLFDAKKIIDAWGFEFKSSFVWCKPQMGIGNYWRNSHEIMLLGVRGGLTARDRSLMSWIQHDRGKHSAKPDKVRSLIEKISPGPYLELFGRIPVPGWMVVGNQVSML